MKRTKISILVKDGDNPLKEIIREIVPVRSDCSKYCCRYNNQFYEIHTDLNYLIYIDAECPEDLQKLQMAVTEDHIKIYEEYQGESSS